MDNRQDKKSEIPQEERRDTFTEEQLQEKNPKDFEQLKAELREKISLKNHIKREERKKRQPKIEVQDLKINIKKPEKEAKTPVNEKKKSVMAKITPEQMNMLVNGISNTVTFIRKTEGVEIEESEPFSKALYEVADANGCLDDLNFLPYLVLAASGTQLAVVIMTKPKKAGAAKLIQSNTDIKKEVQNAPEIPKGQDFDVVDSDELVKKINGI